MENQSNLFQPFAVGETNLCHRVVMAPLTRARADENWVPTKLNSGTPFIVHLDSDPNLPFVFFTSCHKHSSASHT